MTAAAIDPWTFHPHPEVWFLIAAIVGLAMFAVRVIGPKAVRDGSPVVTGRQRAWFVLAVATLWIAADWPMHDIGERYLYFVHMVQHLMLTMIVAPMFLLATPTWLARLIVGDGWFAGKALRRLCHPIVAGLLFNAAFVFVHYPPTVNTSVQNAALHFSLHLLIFGSALLMWMPVCGPLPEVRLSLPAQMLYLFCQSIVPTIPSAWLIFAEHPVYSAYDTPLRLWGIDAVNDQQIAGVFMKLGGGFFLWAIIFALFFRWSARHQEAERAGVLVTERDVLTWDAVQAELDALERRGPAPAEPPP
jgi:putative membrane protein